MRRFNLEVIVFALSALTLFIAWFFIAWNTAQRSTFPLSLSVI